MAKIRSKGMFQGKLIDCISIFNSNTTKKIIFFSHSDNLPCKGMFQDKLMTTLSEFLRLVHVHREGLKAEDHGGDCEGKVNDDCLFWLCLYRMVHNGESMLRSW